MNTKEKLNENLRNLEKYIKEKLEELRLEIQTQVDSISIDLYSEESDAISVNFS